MTAAEERKKALADAALTDERAAGQLEQLDSAIRAVAQREQRHRAELDRRAEAALAARLAAMPEASAELAARIEQCWRLRETDRCPGRCVVGSLRRLDP